MHFRTCSKNPYGLRLRSFRTKKRPALLQMVPTSSPPDQDGKRGLLLRPAKRRRSGRPPSEAPQTSKTSIQARTAAWTPTLGPRSGAGAGIRPKAFRGLFARGDGGASEAKEGRQDVSFGPACRSTGAASVRRVGRFVCSITTFSSPPPRSQPNPGRSKGVFFSKRGSANSPASRSAEENVR